MTTESRKGQNVNKFLLRQSKTSLALPKVVTEKPKQTFWQTQYTAHTPLV